MQLAGRTTGACSREIAKSAGASAKASGAARLVERPRSHGLHGWLRGWLGSWLRSWLRSSLRSPLHPGAGAEPPRFAKCVLVQNVAKYCKKPKIQMF